METKAVQRITEYLAGRGFELTEQDKAEIHARVVGHESAEALQLSNERAKVFYAYRGDLHDFDTTGHFSGKATCAAPALCEGPKDHVLRYAFLEAQASKFFVVVFDGNGKLCEMFDKSELPLIAYRTQGLLKNPDAANRDELAEDDTLVDAQMFSWTAVGRALAYARNNVAADRPEPPGQALLYVLEDGNQKVLWRERI